MASEEIGGYLILGIYGLMFLGAIRIFGLRSVLAVVFGIVFLAIAVAFGTLRGVTSRRY